MTDISLHLTITGRVQGVSYRAWMQGRAQALGLAGWVRNRTDGSVEALVAGPQEQVDALVAECRSGPPAASVAEIATAPATAPQSGEQRATFEILPTA